MSGSASEEQDLLRKLPIETLRFAQTLRLRNLHMDVNLEERERYAASEKLYNETFLTYLKPLRVRINGIRSWKSFSYLAERGFEQWCGSLDGNALKALESSMRIAVIEMNRPMGRHSIASALRLIQGAFRVVESGLHPNSSSSICPLGHLTRLPVHIKNVKGVAVLYDRCVDLDFCLRSRDGRTLLVTQLVPHWRFMLSPDINRTTTARELAARFEEQIIDGKGGNSEFVAEFCRLLFLMLHIDSMHLCYTNCNQAVFFKAEITNGQLTLYSSDVYTCDGRLRNGITWLHGLFGLLQNTEWSESCPGRTERANLFLTLMDDAAGLQGGREGRLLTKDDLAHISQERGWEHETWDMNQKELILTLLQTGRELLRGEWTNVRIAALGNIRVVIKYWSGLDPDGLKHLENERKILMFIRLHHPHLIGTLIPFVIACRHDPRTQTTIVTEHVGEDIRLHDPGNNPCLLVGNKRVEDNEFPSLLAAGERAVKQLHAIGISHRDIDSQNLRIQRIEDGGEVQWRVWLIDFGMATKKPRKYEYEGDLEDIRECLGFDYLTDNEKEEHSSLTPLV